MLSLKFIVYSRRDIQFVRISDQTVSRGHIREVSNNGTM